MVLRAALKYEGSSLDPVSYAGTASLSENEHVPYAGAARGINFGKRPNSQYEGSSLDPVSYAGTASGPEVRG